MKSKNNLLISKGNSMYPLLLDKDIIMLSQSKTLHIDDIVVIEEKSYFLTHRIIYINKPDGYLLTKGDHNLLADPATKFNKVSGKVKKVIRAGKTLNIENLYLLQSAFYFEEIKKINSIFSKQKILFIFLKGLPAYLYYIKRPPQRIYADCDILINPHHLPEVDKIFTSLGYQKQTISHNPFLDLFLKNKAEVSYWKTLNNFRIVFDVHLEAVFFFVQTNNLTPLYSYNLVKEFSQQLLSQKKAVSLDKQKYPLLTAENQIVYLALHLFHDNFRGYHKYLFLEQVINLSKFDEQNVVSIIKKYRLENFLYPVFILLKKYYQPKFSKNFLKQIAPKKEKQELISSLIKSINIFEDEKHILAGINRFKNIYTLSDSYPAIKPLVFLQPGIAALIFFTLLKKITLIVKFNYFRFFRLFWKSKSVRPSSKTKHQ